MNHQVKFLNSLHHALGTPYVWGGSAPGGFDCSGLVYWAAKLAGIKGVPRTSQAQWNYGQPVSPKNLRPGDLVFSEPGRGGPGHVGIYVGNGKVESAPHTGAQVHISQLAEFGSLMGARRILANPQGKVYPAAAFHGGGGLQRPALPFVQPQFGTPALGARQALATVLPGQLQPTPDQAAPLKPTLPQPSLAPLQDIHDRLLKATS